MMIFFFTDLCFFLALSLTLAHLLSSPVNAAEEGKYGFLDIEH